MFLQDIFSNRLTLLFFYLGLGLMTPAIEGASSPYDGVIASQLGSRPFTVTPIHLSPSEQKLLQKEFHAALPKSASLYQTVSESPQAYGCLLEFIGKHQPITFFVKMSAPGVIQDIQVLAYRESVGGEIHRPDFLAQFKNKDLTAPLKIGQDIDGITGATLSAQATARAARASLALLDLATQERLPL